MNLINLKVKISEVLNFNSEISCEVEFLLLEEIFFIEMQLRGKGVVKYKKKEEFFEYFKELSFEEFISNFQFQKEVKMINEIAQYTGKVYDYSSNGN